MSQSHILTIYRNIYRFNENKDKKLAFSICYIFYDALQTNKLIARRIRIEIEISISPEAKQTQEQDYRKCVQYTIQ